MNPSIDDLKNAIVYLTSLDLLTNQEMTKALNRLKKKYNVVEVEKIDA
jgi:ribosome-binding factor A